MGVSHAVEEAGSTPRSIAFQLAQEVFARHDADLADAGSGVVLGMWDPAGLLYGLGLMAVAAVTLVRRAPFGGSIMVRVARCTCDPSGGRSTPEKGQNRSRFAGAGATVGPSRPTPTLGRTPMRERVALIGAGPSGMALLRSLALAEDAGAAVPEVVAFERQDDWGGQWNLDWRTGADRHGEPVHSAMYRDLWINGPKECMEYPDYPFDAHFGRAVSSYLPREAMRDYIVGRVAEMAGRIRPQIRFATAVRWVQPLDDGGFGVTSEDLVTREAVTERFDRVVVATGHFHTPHLPSWPGVETFPGQVQHAHDYRSPEPYTGRRVLVVGSSYSGQDLALQLHRAGAAHVTTAYRARPQDMFGPRVFGDVVGIDQRGLVAAHGEAVDGPACRLQRADLAAHFVAQLRVEVGERLVHQADRGFGDDRAAQRHALLLAAGQLRGLAVEQVVQAQQAGHALQAAVVVARRLLAHLQAEQDVLAHRQVRKQIGELEGATESGQCPRRGRHRSDIAPLQQD